MEVNNSFFFFLKVICTLSLFHIDIMYCLVNIFLPKILSLKDIIMSIVLFNFYLSNKSFLSLFVNLEIIEYKNFQKLLCYFYTTTSVLLFIKITHFNIEIFQLVYPCFILCRHLLCDSNFSIIYF